MTHRTGIALESLEDKKYPTFKEHLKETWRQKPNFREVAAQPESLQNFGMASYWAATAVVVFSSIFLSIPEICRESEFLAAMKIPLIILVLLNVGAANINWLLTSMRGTHMVKFSTISEKERTKLSVSPYLPVGYRFCHKCQMYAPPRSHHCNVCNGCILKRDYHCYLTGSCIGLTTQRRFIALLFHVMTGCFLHMILSGHYVDRHMAFTENYVNYVPFMAIFMLITGQLGYDDFYFLCLMYFCLMVMLVSGMYLAWQWLMVIRGQTSYEATRSIQTYRMGFSKSMYQVFGSVWWMNFIFPMPTTLPTDGVHWERRGQHKTK